MFTAPTWIEGFLIQFVIYIVVPLIIAGAIGFVIKKKTDDAAIGLGSFAIIFVAMLVVMSIVCSVYWYNAYEVPSVQSKVITVKEWQPKAGLSTNSEGLMTIDNAADLMLITTDGEGFVNEENLYFNKFNTRDIFKQLKVNGTYEIKYYGWREGFNSGFPNILSVEKVINENGTVENKYGDYFGTKLS